MSTVLAGIDEAGYGPTLGPLAVGLAVLEVTGVEGAEGGVPDLWRSLEAGVCREAGRGGTRDRQGRVAIADSKRLKLPNSSGAAHPLVNLERGVLSMLAAMGDGGHSPTTDDELFAMLGGSLPAHIAYSGPALALPIGNPPGEIAISANVVRKACVGAGVRVLAMRCRMIGEGQFNAIIERTRNKSETTALAVGEHLRAVIRGFSAGEQPDRPRQRLGIVCDRLGGRTSYDRMLSRELPGMSVTTVDETEERSRYVVTDGAGSRAGVSFMVEGEKHHMAVALASMIAKYCRELAMIRFNRFFAVQHRDLTGIEIRPTAGYALDARRWLSEIGETLTARDRDELVRRA